MYLCCFVFFYPPLFVQLSVMVMKGFEAGWMVVSDIVGQ